MSFITRNPVWMLFCAIVFAIGCNSSNFSAPDKTSSSKNDTDAEPGNGDAEGSDEGGTIAPDSQVDEFNATSTKVPVDIFFGIDTSDSMTHEMRYLEENMQGFLTDLEKGGVDARVTAIGKNFKFPTNLPADKFQAVDRMIDSYDAIGVMTKFFSAGNFPIPLRADASLEVIIVTDDNGKGKENIADAFKGPAGKKAVVDGIIGLKKGLNDKENLACDIPAVGKEYQKLAQETGGAIYDLCEKDWSALLKRLSSKIVVNNRNFKLTKNPNSSGVVVEVGGKKLESNQFSYDAATNMVKISPDVPLNDKDTIRVIYVPS